MPQPGSESIQIQNDLKSYCDEAYRICLTDICVGPDPEAKKKCMDRCYFESKRPVADFRTRGNLLYLVV